jgi:signal transduction histidine kinase
MLSVARGRVASARWSLAIGALFALGASSVLNSFAAGFSWCLVFAMAMGFDYMLGKSYLESRGDEARRTAGRLFVWGCFFSISIFMTLPLVLAATGGGPGRVLGVLMAASSLVSVMLFTFQAPRFMYLTAAPATIALLVMPFFPFLEIQVTPLQGGLGVGCGVVGFLAYIGRSAVNNTKMITGWKTANQAAKDRQLEAEVKRAEAEEANRAKSEFLAVMTHELRTPLNAVIGYAEIIQEDLDAEGREELSEDAGRITGSARHLLGLIDQILNLSSIDAGNEGLAVRDVDVRKLLEDTIAAAQDEAREAGNRISLRVSAGAERALSDGNKLSVAVAALLSNAVKFTSNGLIAVTAELDQHDATDMLSIAVSDTGIGIASERLAAVFKPVTQVEGGATRAKGGMGLGLSIAQRMARAVGGEVSVVSEVGVGSTFTLRTPLRVKTASPQIRAAA